MGNISRGVVTVEKEFGLVVGECVMGTMGREGGGVAPQGLDKWKRGRG